MPFYDRKNHRLRHYDYGRCGYYFITICTKNRIPVLSTISSTIVGSDALVAPQPILNLTPLGEKVLESWNMIEILSKNVSIQKFVFMPDHIHGIIHLDNPDEIVDPKRDFDFQFQERRGRRSLQGLVKDFKSVTTRQYKSLFGGVNSLWQDSFYDTVIRTRDQYIEIWNYIENNPRKWLYDQNR